MESFRGLCRHPVYRIDPDCNLQYLWILPDKTSCTGSCCKCHYRTDQQSNYSGSAAEPDSSGFGMYHGYGSDYPDCNSDPASDCNLNRHRSSSVWYHGCIKLWYWSSDSAGRCSFVHWFCSCKGTYGESSKGNSAILSVHDYYSAADYLYSGYQPWTAGSAQLSKA